MLVYEEKDDSFYMGCRAPATTGSSASTSSSTVSSELRCTPAAAPGEFAVLAPRAARRRVPGRPPRRPLGDPHQLDGAKNFKLMQPPPTAARRPRAAGTTGSPHRDDVFIEDFELFDGFIAIAERSGGLLRLRLLDAGRQGASSSRPTSRPTRWACRSTPSPTPPGCATATPR